MKRLMLTLFKDQLINSIGITVFWDRCESKSAFNQIIKKILFNFIPHETVTCDDRDPSWTNSKIKGLIQEKNISKKYYFQNNKGIQLFRRFQCIQNLLTATIEKPKKQFYSRFSTKLMDPTIRPKAYCSILKTLLNN